MRTPGSWLAFWSGSHRIYVSERHREVHYRRVAEDIRSLVPSSDAVVLDWGCGDALFADRIAAVAGRVILCDAADTCRQRLMSRFCGNATIVVAHPCELEAVASGTVDLFVINSVVQYLSPGELTALLAVARRLLSVSGALIVADVIPRHDGFVADVGHLLWLGWRHGFLISAAAGMVATIFSPYRRLRSSLGLVRFSEREMIEQLREAGFSAERLALNLGFNQQRMAFRGTVPGPNPRS